MPLPSDCPPSFDGPVRRAVAALGLPQLALTVFERTGSLALSRRISAQAVLTPAAVALRDVAQDGSERAWSWQALDELIEAGAAELRRRGARAGRVVVIGLPSGAEHVVASNAAWRAGATVCPLDPGLPRDARERLLGRLTPAAVIADWAGALPVRGLTSSPAPSPLGLAIADPHSIVITGGSTHPGKPVVQSGSLWGRLDAAPPDLAEGHGVAVGQRQLVTLPLFHGFGFGYANWIGLAYGHELTVMRRFDAALALELIERHRIEYVPTVPTAMRRMLASQSFAARDLSSLEVLFHAGGPCPPAVKRAWMERIGPERVFEGYGATDISLECTVRGDAWLRRPGTVGRPRDAEVRIVDEYDRVRPSGATGAVKVRPTGHASAHPQLLDESHGPTRDFRHTGDLGWVDDEGWLFIAGRVDDVIISGAAKIHPEAIETVLLAHHAVEDAAVVGVPDSDLGHRVLAVIEPAGHAADLEGQLRAWCAQRLAPESRPRSYRFVATLDRNAAGKLRRFALGGQGAESS